MHNSILYILSILLLVSCRVEPDTKQTKDTTSQRGLITEKAMVVSARNEASSMGVKVMQLGGNAFDAMVATELTLALTYPRAGNVMGGGFMVYRSADRQKGSLDYREKAPMTAHRDMYLDAEGNVIADLSFTGGLAIGVPGTLAGVLETHQKKGKLPLDQILNPIIDLAEEGYILTEKQAKKLNAYREQFLKVNEEESIYTNKHAVGDTIKNIAYADMLRRVLSEGRADFYEGGTSGEYFLSTIKKHGGIITQKDLSSYKAIWRKPISFEYDNYTLTSMAPPSSGGITLSQILSMIEPFPLAEYGHNTAEYIQLITEAERRAYADRNYFLGDPDFVDIPKGLLDDSYIKQRMQSYKKGKASSSAEVSHGDPITIVESDETTHYSIVDPYGNAIAVTTTLNGNYGSKVFCKQLGLFLNNEMDDFSAKPGVPNAYGLVGAEANAIAPGKRMLSSMTPTIVEKDDKLFMVVGTPGGSTIITSVLQTFLNVAEHGMTMQQAVDAPRFHHQWLPDEIRIEPKSMQDSTKNILSKMGYRLNENNSRIIGKVDAILVLPNGTYEGGADRRGDDKAVGY